MKKMLSILIAVLIAMIPLTSCFPYTLSYPYKASISPFSQSMTKWEADNFEMYITDREIGLLVWHDGETTYFYDIHFTFSSMDILVFDKHFENTDPQTYYTVNELGGQQYGCIAAAGSYDPETPELCTISFDHSAEYGAQFPVESLAFRRVATDLTADDFPEIKLDTAYENCPMYSLGSKWISEDRRITIVMEEGYVTSSYGHYRSPVGSVTVAGDPVEGVYIAFSEHGSQAYVGSIFPTPVINNCYDVSLASDIWECKYAEDSFTATVVCSKYYEPGDTIVFMRQE